MVSFPVLKSFKLSALLCECLMIITATFDFDYKVLFKTSSRRLGEWVIEISLSLSLWNLLNARHYFRLKGTETSSNTILASLENLVIQSYIASPKMDPFHWLTGWDERLKKWLNDHITAGIIIYIFFCRWIHNFSRTDLTSKIKFPLFSHSVEFILLQMLNQYIPKAWTQKQTSVFPNYLCQN